MTVDITTIDTDIEILPAAQPVKSGAVAQLMAHAQAMTAAKALADALCGTDLVPATYKGKPDNGAAAILYGAELGLNPIQSLQQIFVVHGSPAIYARTAVALVKRHGIVVQTVESTDDSVTVTATDPRTGQAETSTWDIARATQAKYTTNAKYQTDPQAMLYAKAAMEVCRKIAPDILLGIPYSREELDLEQQPVRVRADRADRGLKGLRAAVVDAETESAPTEPTPDAPEVEMITSAQSRKLHALLRENELEDPDAGLAWISAAIGQTVASTKNLTKAQAITVIDKLDIPSSERPTTTEGNE